MEAMRGGSSGSRGAPKEEDPLEVDSFTYRQQPVRPEERLINDCAVVQEALRKLVTGASFLAVSWSTVVLLGGFVSALPVMEFWFLTIMSLVLASRFLTVYEYDDGLLKASESVYHGISKHLSRKVGQTPLQSQIPAIILGVPIAIFQLNGLFLVVLYLFGPIFCIIVSVMQLSQKLYRGAHGANLKAALDIFYTLTLAQGVFFYFWLAFFWSEPRRVVAVNKQCSFGCWGRQPVERYLRETKLRCAKDLASPAGWNLIIFAVNLVATGTWDDQLSGARILDTLIAQEGAKVVRLYLLSSHQCMRNLIAALGHRGHGFKEIRERATRIVADVAGDIVIAQFPGALQCISSLLDCSDTHETLHMSSEDHNILFGDRVHPRPSMAERPKEGKGPTSLFYLIYSTKVKATDRSGRTNCQCNYFVSRGPEELILKGFVILKKLARNEHNCREICNDEVLLSRIRAPMNSHPFTSIDHIHDAASVDRLNGSMGVVSLLINAHGEASRRLRQEIATNADTVQGMIFTLQGDTSMNCAQELKAQAIEILTQVALDTDSIAMTSGRREYFLMTLFTIFVAEVEETMGLRRNAGDALRRLLSVDTISSSVAILEMFWELGSTDTMTEREHGGLVHQLAEILASDEMHYRLRAAEILEILCNHSIECIELKDSVIYLLCKIVEQILCFDMDATAEASNTSESVNNVQSQDGTSSGDQRALHPRRNHDEPENGKLISSLLALTITIHDKLIDAGDFTRVVRTVVTEHELVKKLNAVVEGSRGTADYPRIVKNTCQLRAILGRT